MSDSSLKHEAATGMIWSAIQKYSTMFVGFISSIILARLLTPVDYGYIGMLAIFMSLAEVFIDAGFGSAIIQKKEPTQTDYSTVFYFNIGMSFILYLILFFCAPSIAKFYDMPILCKILRIQGLILFIYAFNIIQRNLIRKNLLFRKLSLITIITSIIALIITVIMAYLGCGVWALVTQNFIGSLIPCVFFWITTKWHPTKEFSWKSFRELFGFGSYMLLSHILGTFSQKISGLLIGKWFEPATMGYYSKASTTADYATSSISGVLLQTTYPLYSIVQDDKEKLANIVKRITTTLAYLTVPLLSLLILIAKPIFIILYTDRWINCVPYFQMLCIAGLAICLQGVNYQTIAAIGKSRTLLFWNIIKQTIGIILQVAGLILGNMWGLLIGIVISAWFTYIVNISLVSKYVGYKSLQQLKDLAPIFLVSGFAFIISYYSIDIMNFGLFVDGICKAIIFGIIYIGWSIIFKPDSYNYTLSIIQELRTQTKK